MNGSPFAIYSGCIVIKTPKWGLVPDTGIVVLMWTRTTWKMNDPGILVGNGTMVLRWYKAQMKILDVETTSEGKEM